MTNKEIEIIAKSPELIKKMVYLFGDYKIFILGKETKNDYCTLKVCIYKAD